MVGEGRECGQSVMLNLASLVIQLRSSAYLNSTLSQSRQAVVHLRLILFSNEPAPRLLHMPIQIPPNKEREILLLNEIIYLH